MATSAPVKSQTRASSLRILLVDDDVAGSDALSRLLVRKGHEVRQQNDPAGVIPSALDFQPHLIVLDFVMPGCDGATVAWQLTAHPELRRVRVMVASGHPPDEIRKSLPPSVIPIMSKPIDMEAFLRLLDDEANGPV